MKHIIILCMSVLFFSVASAETLRFSWTYPADEEALIDGFRLYHVDGETSSAKSSTIASARTIEYEQVDDGECHTFYLTAYKDQVESTPSQSASWCPAVEIPAAVVRPVGPGTLMIEVVK